MSVPLSPVANSQNFGTWLTRTNQMAEIISANVVTTSNTVTGGFTSGNGTVNGHFGSNTLFAIDDLRGGNVTTSNTLSISSNAAFKYNSSNLVVITANSTSQNVTIVANTVSITGNTRFSNDVVIDSRALVGANVVLTTNEITVGNSVTNTVINSTSIRSTTANVTTLNVTGNSNVANLTVSGVFQVNNTANVASTLRVGGDLIVVGNLSFTAQVTGDFNPTVNDTYQLGNNAFRWILNSSRGNFSNNILVANAAGNTTITPTSILTTGTVNATSYTVGSVVVANSTTLNVNGAVINSSGVFVTNTVNATTLSVGSIVVANSTTLNVNGAVINSSGAFVTNTVNAATLSVGTALVGNSTTLSVNGAVVNSSGAFVTSTVNATTLSVGSALVGNSTTLSVNGAVINSSGAFVTNTVNAASHTAGSIGTGGGGTVSNTTTVFVGNNTINTSISAGSLNVNGAVIANNNGLFSTGTVNTNTLSVGGAVFGNSTTFNVNGAVFNSSGAFVTNTVNAATLSVGSVVVANSTTLNVNGAVVNSTGGYFAGTVNAASVATLGVILNGSTQTIQANGTAGTAGFYLTTGGASGNVYWSPVQGVNAAVSYTWSNTHTFQNTVTLSSRLVLGSSSLSANGSDGVAGHVLHSNGSATFWAPDDGITSLTTGNGLTGGPISNTGTISVLANTGLVANATGLYVNATYIGTITANNTSFVGSVSAANVVSNTQLSANLANYGQLAAENTWTANQLISKSEPRFTLNKTAAGEFAGFIFNDRSTLRWLAGLNGNQDWAINRHNASGVYQDTPFWINQSDGRVAIERLRVSVNNWITDSNNASRLNFVSGAQNEYRVARNTSTDWHHLFQTSDGSTRWLMNNYGDLHCAGNIIAYWSDERLKENIESINNWKEPFVNIRAVTFSWNKEGRKLSGKKENEREPGFLAQEVQKYIPEAVVEQPLQFKDSDKNPRDDLENFDPENPYLTVRHEKLIPTMWAAIQGLIKEVDDLKQQLTNK